MKKVLMFFGLIISFLSCNTTEPPPPEKTILLTLEDASSIEAWINLTTTNLQLPTTLTLKQNDLTRSIINLDKPDTMLYIDSLLPNQPYTFQVSCIQNQVSSNKLSVTTMDTTSHNFTWQMWTFGDVGSSVLYDVAIIAEDNIWCVGEIMIADSSQNGYTTYNAVHWGGSSWELKRILYNGGIWSIRSIFAFNANDIWFSAFVRYDGQNFIELPISNVLIGWRINKMWGTSSEDIIVVGNNGTIVRYNGTLWWKMYSGTELDIYDIWGDYNERNDEWEILAVASNYFHSFDRKILKVEGNRSTIVTDSPLNQPLKAVWFKTNKQYYVTGSGIYQKHILKDELWQNDPQDITTYSTYAVRGNNTNDVIGVGAFGDVLHFNGKNWKTDYQEASLSYGAYYGVAVKGNAVVAVGTEQSQAVITIGKR